MYLHLTTSPKSSLSFHKKNTNQSCEYTGQHSPMAYLRKFPWSERHRIPGGTLVVNGSCHVRECDRAQVQKGRGVAGPGWRLHVEMNFLQHMKSCSSCFLDESGLIVLMLECLFKYLWSSPILYLPLT